jgi:hypothetical protein
VGRGNTFHDIHPLGFRGSNYLLRLSGVDCERLFTKDMLPGSDGGEALFFVVGMRGADVDDVDFWVYIDVTVVGVDFGFDRIWGRGWKDCGDETGAFFLGGRPESCDFMVSGSGRARDEEVGSEAG